MRRAGKSLGWTRLTRTALLALVLAADAALATSTVMKVKDGDSLVVRSVGREVEIRLAYIDAPELDQAYGRQAGAVLRSLVGGRRVRLGLIGGDAHRRIVARVLLGSRDVNAEMVRRGFAWVRREFRHPRELARLEDRARAARRGLWARADPVPPWVWREARGKKRGSGTGRAGAGGSKPAVPSSAVPAVRCGAKRYCSQMTTCGEARAYLRRCDLPHLDRDGDGVPCEKLCR